MLSGDGLTLEIELICADYPFFRGMSSEVGKRITRLEMTWQLAEDFVEKLTTFLIV